MRCHDSLEGMHDVMRGNDKCEAMLHSEVMHDVIKERIKLYILFHQNGIVKYENVNHTIFKTAKALDCCTPFKIPMTLKSTNAIHLTVL